MVGLVFVCIYLTLSHNSSLVLTDQNNAWILLDLCIGGFALILTVNNGRTLGKNPKFHDNFGEKVWAFELCRKVH